MKMKDLQKNYRRKPSVSIGTHTLKFAGIDFNTNDNDDVTNFYIHFEGYNRIYLKYFDEDNFQLDMLLDQLGIEDLSDRSIKACLGKEVIVHGYLSADEQYTNYSFNKNYTPKEDDILE